MLQHVGLADAAELELAVWVNMADCACLVVHNDTVFHLLAIVPSTEYTKLVGTDLTENR